VVLRIEPGCDAAHDHVDGNGANVQGEDSAGDFDVFLDQAFVLGLDFVMDELEDDHHGNGEKYGAKNGCDCNTRIKFFAHKDCRTDGTGAYENRHGDGGGYIGHIASEGFDGIGTFEDKLDTDDQEDHATENLERCKLSLDDIAEDHIADDCKDTENNAAVETCFDEIDCEGFLVVLLDDVNQIQDDQKWIKQHKQQKARLDNGHCIGL